MAGSRQADVCFFKSEVEVDEVEVEEVEVDVSVINTVAPPPCGELCFSSSLKNNNRATLTHFWMMSLQGLMSLHI